MNRGSGSATPSRRTAWLIGLGVAVILTGLALLPGHEGDTSHYLFWTYQAVSKGISWIYAGTYPIDFAIYPPLIMYPWTATGAAYLALVDPNMGFDQFTTSNLLPFFLKLTPVALHACLAAYIYVVTRSWGASPRWAVGSGIAFGITPGAAFDTAIWGQPDALHSLFLVTGLVGIVESRPLLTGASYALAALAKPQAWALGPLFAVLSIRRFGLVRSLPAAGIGAAVVAVGLAPFFLDRRWRDLLRLPGEVNNAMDSASANANNLWWIVTGAVQPFVPDSAPFAGPLSIRDASLVFLAAILLFVLWRAWVRDHPLAVAAYMSYGFFLFVTRAHENHSFAVIAMLAPLIPFSRMGRVLFGTTSLTLFLNIVLHDPVTAEWLWGTFGRETIRGASLAASWFNLAVFGVWTVAMLRGAFQLPWAWSTIERDELTGAAAGQPAPAM